MASVAHSTPCDSRLAHRHVRRAAGVWILAECPVAVRSRPRDWHRRGRCDCRRRERGAKSARGHDAPGGGASHDGRSGRRAGGHRARAVGGFCPDGVHSRHLRAVLPSVRVDDCLRHHHLVHRFVDAVSRPRGASVTASDRAIAISRRTHRREILFRVQHRVRSHLRALRQGRRQAGACIGAGPRGVRWADRADRHAVLARTRRLYPGAGSGVFHHRRAVATGIVAGAYRRSGAAGHRGSPRHSWRRAHRELQRFRRRHVYECQ